jgi:hypothetical protein
MNRLVATRRIAGKNFNWRESTNDIPLLPVLVINRDLWS